MRKCRWKFPQLEAFSNFILARNFSPGQIWIHNQQSLAFFDKYRSESMSAEAMAACEEIIEKLMADLESSVGEALMRKYENKQFNWVQANPIYRG